MKILIVSKCPTHPTDAGNRWWILSQAEMLISMGHEVHFLYINELPLKRDAAPYIESLEQTQKYWGDKFHLFTVSKFQKYKMIAAKLYRMKFGHNYWKVDDQYPFGLEQMVNELDGTIHFDVCIINYYYLSRLFEHINIPKKAIATHDCIAYKQLKTGMPTLCITADTEAKAMQRCPHIFALQEQEADYFQLLSPNSKVYNLYGKYDYHPQPIAGNHKMVFLSGNNDFNQNGIKWFLREVFPVIRKTIPDAELLIGGSICKVLPTLGNIEGVTALGYIDDPAAFYAKADVAINPVYQGMGLKIKTFESISFDKVTLVHPHSMAGVFRKDKAPLFASEKPDMWAEHLKQVWEDVEYIKTAKLQNKEYLDAMNAFIITEYKRFLES